MALGLAAVAAAVPGPLPGPAGAQAAVPVPAPGLGEALEAVPVRHVGSPAGAAAVAAAAEWAAALVVTRVGRGGRRT